MIKWLYKVSDKKYGSGEGLKYPKPARGVVWVYAINPTDKELEKLSKDFKISQRRLKVYKRERRSQRYSFRPLCFTFVDYCIKKNDIHKTNILFMVDKHCIVTILESPIQSYATIFKRMSETLKTTKLSVMNLLFEILDEDIEENYDVLQAIEDKIVALEKEVASGRIKSIEKVVDLRRSMNIMSKAFWGSSRITFLTKKGLTPVEMTDNEKRMMEDLHDAFIHQLNIISSQKEMLTDAITIYQTTISNKLANISNKINVSIKALTWIMLFLTGITFVLTIPNTVATFFGIPSLPFTTADTPLIYSALFISLLVPLLWFFFYWKRVLTRDEPIQMKPK
jgi:Mg2+ and Co2+ transporter CorA